MTLVGTYPPTECGIATYTSNLRRALAGYGHHVDVVRLIGEVTDEVMVSDPEVALHWRRERPDDLARAVGVASRSDIVVLQHEFGIYPGPDGGDVVEFVDRCDRPVVTVMHTVRDEPSAGQRRIIEAIAYRSDLSIVHSDVACSRLVTTHAIDPSRVAVVPHGAEPNLARGPEPGSVPLMLTWGLMGPGKGIEHGITAVAIMRDEGLDVRYVVAGQTHPNVLARHGEHYRRQLETLAVDLGVADLVEFDATYRDWDSLRQLVRSAAVVLLPYDTREQVTSGVLVEALAAAKPVVATAFPHAVELARTGAVALVPHEDPIRCAQSVRAILDHPELRGAMQRAALGQAARHDWSMVGRRYVDLLRCTLRAARWSPALTG